MIRAALLVIILLAFVAYAVARDTTGLSAQLTPKQNEWVQELHSPGGAWCCSDADGIDPNWRVGRRGFEVMIKDEWVEVLPDAVIKEVNRIGVARAWVGYVDGKPFIRCFLAGAQT